MIRVGSLFSGIGGLDLGLERAGMRVIWQCEADADRRGILRRHWPDIPCFESVEAIKDAPLIDLLAGGFPCQPWSITGHRRGTTDERWLWPEFARVIRLLRPRYVLVENVPGLLDGGIEHVLSDLAQLRFDAEWSIVSACAVGAPHTRDRLFLVAYANGGDGQARMGPEFSRRGALPPLSGRARAWGDSVSGAISASGADDREVDGSARWLVEAGGNAVVPQVAELVGRAIVAAHNRGA